MRTSPLFIAVATAVLLIARPGSAHPIIIPQFRHMLQRNSNSGTAIYQAPLHSCEWDIVPNSYAVFLRRGVSLEQHKRAVGRDADLDSGTSCVYDGLDSNRIYYHGTFDDDLLVAIRADPGVEFVECDLWVHIAGGL